MSDSALFAVHMLDSYHLEPVSDQPARQMGLIDTTIPTEAPCGSSRFGATGMLRTASELYCCCSCFAFYIPHKGDF